MNRDHKNIKVSSKLGISLLLHFGTWLPDRIFVSLYYQFKLGKKLNLKNPQLFGEKMQWLKLYDRKPEYTRMVDKYEVKDFVSKRIGNQYVIPALGVWDIIEDIQWDVLPNQFVLKTTHGGGSMGVVICRDKSLFDIEEAKYKLKKSLKQDIYKYSREWPYKDVKRRIFAEQYIKPANAELDLSDYKWYCFNGEPKFCQVIKDRSSKETIDFFDTEWVHQEFVGLNPNAGPAVVEPKRPVNLYEQLRIARELSKGIPFCRIDLYSVDEKVFFGEITFFPMSGLGIFRPEKYNEILGQMIKLPKVY